jgi:ubiquinol oxidase
LLDPTVTDNKFCFIVQILNGLFLVSPSIAYNFSELIEMHAGLYYFSPSCALSLKKVGAGFNLRLANCQVVFTPVFLLPSVDTYAEFADENEDLLKTLPPPPVAVAYYDVM